MDLTIFCVHNLSAKKHYHDIMELKIVEPLTRPERLCLFFCDGLNSRCPEYESVNDYVGPDPIEEDILGVG